MRARECTHTAQASWQESVLTFCVASRLWGFLCMLLRLQGRLWLLEPCHSIHHCPFEGAFVTGCFPHYTSPYLFLWRVTALLSHTGVVGERISSSLLVSAKPPPSTRILHFPAAVITQALGSSDSLATPRRISQLPCSAHFHPTLLSPPILLGWLSRSL